MKNKVIAVVVTYNRLKLLKRVVDSLSKQTYELSNIIIVNNGSSDGTTDYLTSLENDSNFIVINQENVGGSGGFYRGIQEALKFDCNWIWCMDDDVFPMENCLEVLLNYSDKSTDRNGILCPKRIMNGSVFISETKKINLTNPFKFIYNCCLTREDLETSEAVDIEGMAFEGPLIKREVVENVGLPNKDFFILYDDTEYSYRAVLAGFHVKVVSKAVMNKYNHQSTLTYKEDKIKNKWKLAYHFRNTAFFCHKYGKNIFFKYLGTLPFFVSMYAAITFNFLKGHKYSFSDYFLILRMIKNGIKGKLGIIK